MAVVEVYTSPFCGYCRNAKRLLTERGAAVTEIDVMEMPERRDEMVARAGGRRTVPQVFIDGAHVGGYAELVALDREGKLAAMLEAAP
jgi:glutaredoxin 3